MGVTADSGVRSLGTGGGKGRDGLGGACVGSRSLELLTYRDKVEEAVVCRRRGGRRCSAQVHREFLRSVGKENPTRSVTCLGQGNGGGAAQRWDTVRANRFGCSTAEPIWLRARAFRSPPAAATARATRSSAARTRGFGAGCAGSRGWRWPGRDSEWTGPAAGGPRQGVERGADGVLLVEVQRRAVMVGQRPGGTPPSFQYEVQARQIFGRGRGIHSGGSFRRGAS